MRKWKLVVHENNRDWGRTFRVVDRSVKDIIKGHLPMTAIIHYHVEYNGRMADVKMKNIKLLTK